MKETDRQKNSPYPMTIGSEDDKLAIQQSNDGAKML